MFHVKRRRRKVRFVRNAQAWAFLTRSLAPPLQSAPAALGCTLVPPAGGTGDGSGGEAVYPFPWMAIISCARAV